MRSYKFLLPVRIIASLLGTSESTAKRLLHKASADREITYDYLGQLICEFRVSNQESSIERYLNRWTGPI